MKTYTYLAAGTALLIAGATAAGAATVTTAGSSGTEDMTVSMTVENSCDFTISSNVDFGTLGPVASGQTEATPGGISVTCTEGTEFSLALEDPGAGRVLTNAALDTVPYSLALDAASNVTATGSAQPYAVAGTLSAISSQPPAGTYGDTVTVTLTIDATQS